MAKKQNTSMLHWNGTSQRERMSNSLYPDSIKIDERSLADMLSFSAEYAGLIKYFDKTNSPIGDWKPFLKNNLTVYLAKIVSTDLHKIEKEHNKYIKLLENSPRAEEKLEALEGMLIQILKMARQINDWYVHALEMDKLNLYESSALENELEESIKQQLAHHLVELLVYQKELGFDTNREFTEERIRESFHKIWFKKHKPIGARFIDLAKQEEGDRIKDYTKKLRIQFRTFYSVTAFVVQSAPLSMAESLSFKSDHKPDVALFIAFLQMFKKLQNQANKTTEKHLDFYYYNVLKQKQRGAVPDKANIYFDVAKHIDTHYLEQGTLLNAGVDEDGNAQQYITDQGIELNQARIGSLKTMYVAKNPKIGIGSSYKVITNVYVADTANSIDGNGGEFINNEENWPIFGHDILERPEGEQQMRFADLGWAISSPILELEEGHRVVQFNFRFDPASMYTLNLLIKDISKNQEISREDAFARIFKNSLVVQFTTDSGWVEAYSTEVLPPDEWGAPEINIIATIPTAAESIRSYHETLHGQGYSTNYPIARIMHRNEGSFFTYSFLKELRMKTVNINVDVTGMKRLQVSTDLGTVDASVPFYPFGPVPSVGSYMMVGKQEIFRKELTDLQVHIEWHNLPDNAKGLRGYYKEYGLGVKNDQYTMKMTALSEGHFHPAEDGSPLSFKMFENAEHSPMSLSNKKVISGFDLNALNITPDTSFTMPAVYNNETQAGFLKFELTGPKAAFGHSAYTSVFAKVMAHNTDPKRKGAEKPLPNQPFTPMIRTITMDYSASTELSVLSVGKMTAGKDAREQIYHIHPFGIERTFFEGKTTSLNLLPNYDDDAYLFIGLEGFKPPGNVSFLFELKENLNLFSELAAKKAKPEIFWSYLVDNQWRDFSQNQLLSDGTNGFNNSGIICLELPKDMNQNSDIITSGMHWIRVTLRGDASLMPKCRKVATQAVSCTWVDNGTGASHLLKPLPADSIRKLQSSINQIRRVYQPFPSFGGRVGEDKTQFYTRTSERLRHKNRAVSAWDYERLVLDKFPNIHQVKCVTHVGNESYVDAGSVSIVVVPKIDKSSTAYHLPMVNQTILDDVKEYLKSLSSPFVNIQVRNPIYERVKISAGIRFSKGMNNGTYLKKLNQDIIEYMAPWMMGSEQELQLGGSLIKDAILSFIEKLDYVEFVTKFSIVQVFQDDETGFDVDDTAIHTTNSPLITATKPWSILIPFEFNQLYLLDDDTFQVPEKAAVSSMIIDGDFVMTDEKERDFDDFVSDKRRKKLDEEEDDVE